MKERSLMTVTGHMVSSVICDITNMPCPDSRWLPETDAPCFESGQLTYSGGYSSDFDMLNVDLDLHPDVVVALYLLTKQGKAALENDNWPYRQPKIRITIEHLP